MGSLPTTSASATLCLQQRQPIENSEIIRLQNAVEFWMNLQNHYELKHAEDLLGNQIGAIAPLMAT